MEKKDIEKIDTDTGLDYLQSDHSTVSYITNNRRTDRRDSLHFSWECKTQKRQTQTLDTQTAIYRPLVRTVSYITNNRHTDRRMHRLTEMLHSLWERKIQKRQTQTLDLTVCRQIVHTVSYITNNGHTDRQTDRQRVDIFTMMQSDRNSSDEYEPLQKCQFLNCSDLIASHFRLYIVQNCIFCIVYYTIQYTYMYSILCKMN